MARIVRALGASVSTDVAALTIAASLERVRYNVPAVLLPGRVRL
jgi:hypothetical protein